MSKTPQSDRSAELNPLSASTSNLFALPTISARNSFRNGTNFQPVQSKILEEVNNEDYQLDIEENNTAQEEYFKADADKDPEQDDEETLKRRFHTQRDSNPYESGFKPLVFIKYFVMHMLFFCLMGPFIIILSPIFGWKVLRNQDFIGLTRSFLSQALTYCALMAFMIVFYVTETEGLKYIEIYMMLVTLIIRVIIIASKYAYQSELYLRLMETIILTREDKYNEVLLGKWRLQTDDIILEEIQAAILRLEIDSSLFFFNFLGETNPELKEKFSKGSKKVCRLQTFSSPPPEPEEEGALSRSQSTKRERTPSEEVGRSSRRKWLTAASKAISFSRKESAQPGQDETIYTERTPKEKQLYSQSTTAICKTFISFLKPQKLENQYLYGYNLLFDLRKNAREIRFRALGITSLIVAIIRALIPTFYRMYEAYYKKLDVPVFSSRPEIVGIVFVLNAFFFWANFYTLIVAVQDFSSKVWCFKQLGFLISPKKINEFKTKKLYPTLNIFDPITIKTWSSLRKIMKDYGKKFILRNNFNITVSMIFYFFIMCTFVLQMLGVLKTYNDPLLLIVFAYETIVFFSVFMSVITGAAFLNNQYQVHKNLLKKNKTIISDLAKLSHLYVGKESIKPDNIIYKEGLKVLKKELGDENFEHKLITRGEKLISMIDEIIEELEFEEANDPVTVMGIKIDYQLLQRVSIGVVSLIFAVGQSFVNK